MSLLNLKISHFSFIIVYCYVFCYRSFKALLKLPRLVDILHNLSVTHSINPLLEAFVPQLVSNGIKQELSEESDTRALLEIVWELLREVDFEPALVTVIGRSEFTMSCSL